MTIPVSCFYSDPTGVELYRQITEHEAYYLYRSEAALLRDRAALLAASLPTNCVILEIGCGDGRKIAPLLRCGDFAFVANDVSADFLESVEAWYRKHAPRVPMSVFCADAFGDIASWSSWSPPAGRPLVLAWLGSSLGNLESPEGVRAQIGSWIRALQPEGVILGYDLWHDHKAEKMREAYDNDITEAFIRNGFKNHCETIGRPVPPESAYAVHVEEGRVTMGLVVDGTFEPIEVSRKFLPGQLEDICRGMGLEARQTCVDEDHQYAIALFTCN